MNGIAVYLVVAPENMILGAAKNAVYMKALLGPLLKMIKSQLLCKSLCLLT